MKRVAVAVSGGVDSLCALYLLKRQGYDCLALHGLFQRNTSPPEGLSELCARLNIPFHALDLADIFEKKVINYFTASYANGLTPNPCAICNREIKFGALRSAALNLGADFLATGHYCRLERDALTGAKLLAKPADRHKEQNYFLSLAPRETLNTALFPLYGLTKPQTRQIVAEANLKAPLEKESQDICFISKGDQSEFLANHAQKFHGNLNGQGPVLLRNSKDKETPVANLPQIGSHNGLWRYTIGQRRGLNLPWKEPLYVYSLEKAKNALVVAPRELLEMEFCAAKNINYFLDPDLWPIKLFVRLRYNQKLCAATVNIEADSLKISLHEPRFATAPGQIAAIYDEYSRILAGAIVESWR